MQWHLDGGLLLDANYRVIWDGPEQTPIYAMNHGRHSHGIADPQISLAAWRSAMILNDMTEQELFRVQPEGKTEPMIDWPGRMPAPAHIPGNIATAMAHSQV
ncbi:MAG: hypothetical protein ACK5II_14155 [Paracoccus sp. (in: a-proteobacteria)]